MWGCDLLAVLAMLAKLMVELGNVAGLGYIRDVGFAYMDESSVP
jgi:hypothetical protein